MRNFVLIIIATLTFFACKNNCKKNPDLFYETSDCEINCSDKITNNFTLTTNCVVSSLISTVINFDSLNIEIKKFQNNNQLLLRLDDIYSSDCTLTSCNTFDCEQLNIEIAQTQLDFTGIYLNDQLELNTTIIINGQETTCVFKEF